MPVRATDSFRGGSPDSVEVTDGGVTVDNSKVIKTDVAASNGVIHVIDTVVLPN